MYELPVGNHSLTLISSLGSAQNPKGENMPRSKSSQYTKKENRIIYILLNPLSKEFYIGHCKKTLLKDIFKHHYYGRRYQTKNSFSKLNKQRLHPCLFILEELYSTKVEAFNYVICWTKIFYETGYTSLNQGNVLEYIKELYEQNILIYNKRKQTEVDKICNCNNCIVANYGRKKCPLYKGEKNE